MKFEEKLSRIEEITEKIRNSQTSLDDSLKLYEEGVKLNAELQKELDEAKRKVEIITGNDINEAATEEYTREE